MAEDVWVVRHQDQDMKTTVNLLSDYRLLFVDTHLFEEAIRYQGKIKKRFHSC